MSKLPTPTLEEFHRAVPVMGVVFFVIFLIFSFAAIIIVPLLFQNIFTVALLILLLGSAYMYGQMVGTSAVIKNLQRYNKRLLEKNK